MAHVVRLRRDAFERLCEAKGWGSSTPERAQHLGVDRTVLTRLLNGDRQPSAETVGRMLGALEVADYFELFELRDESEAQVTS